MSVKNKEYYSDKIQNMWKKILEADWTDPLNLLGLAIVIVGLFAAKVYFVTGLLLGLLLTYGVMQTVCHCPLWVRRLVVKYPVLSDFILSSLALIGVGSLFGSGLTLGIGAVVSGILFGFCIPSIDISPEVA